MTEKFSLKWNDFQSNVSKSFGALRNENYLHDVTLVGDDHHQISAHRVVLSACSEYFKSIFKNSNYPMQHPVLCLSGIISSDFNNILDYIYNGQIQIYQDDLDRFLDIAQRLKLDGLMASEDNRKEEEKTYNKQEPIITSVNDDENFVPIQEDTSVKTVSVNLEEMNDIDGKIEEYIGLDETGNYKCNLCGKKTGRHKRHLQNHIETHLEGLSFSCQFCDKTFRSRNSVAIHKNRFHK